LNGIAGRMVQAISVLLRSLVRVGADQAFQQGCYNKHNKGFLLVTGTADNCPILCIWEAHLHRMRIFSCWRVFLIVIY
jgi:hypothetical protein